MLKVTLNDRKSPEKLQVASCPIQRESYLIEGYRAPFNMYPRRLWCKLLMNYTLNIFII